MSKSSRLVFFILFTAIAWAIATPSLASPHQCSFAERGAELQPFVNKLAHACESLAALCQSEPDHYNCISISPMGVSRTDSVIADSSRTDSLSRTLERNWDDSWAYVMDDLFPTTSNGVADDYLKKLQILDEESRIEYPVRKALIAHLVLVGTHEWMGRYGDRIKKMYESGILAHQGGVVLGALSLGAVAYTGRSKGINPGELVRSVPFLSKRIRLLTTLGAVGTVAMTYAPSMVGLASAQSELHRSLNIQPSPAHMVRWKELYEEEVIKADMDAAAANLDRGIFRSIFVDGSWAAVGFATGKFAHGAMKATGKVSKLFSFLRVLPLATVAATAAGYATGKAYDLVSENKLQGRLENAKTPDELNEVLNEVYYFYIEKTHFASEMMDLHKAIVRFSALDALTQEGPGLDLARASLSHYFAPRNNPDITGAHFLQKLMCDSDGREEHIQKASWYYLDYVRRNLRAHKAALSNMIGFLSDIALTDQSLENQKRARVESSSRWLSDTTELLFDLRPREHRGIGKEPTHIQIKNIFERIYTIEANNQNPNFSAYYHCD